MTLILYFGVASAAFYLLLLLIWKKNFFQINDENNSKFSTFEIFKKNDALIACRRNRLGDFFSGLLFSAAFYLSLPFLIWMYGFWTAVLLVAAPFLLVFVGSQVVDGHDQLVSMLALVLLRAIVGIWLFTQNHNLARKNRIQNGWLLIGESNEKSARKAKKNFQMK